MKNGVGATEEDPTPGSKLWYQDFLSKLKKASADKKPKKRLLAADKWVNEKLREEKGYNDPNDNPGARARGGGAGDDEGYEDDMEDEYSEYSDEEA